MFNRNTIKIIKRQGAILETLTKFRLSLPDRLWKNGNKPIKLVGIPMGYNNFPLVEDLYVSPSPNTHTTTTTINNNNTRYIVLKCAVDRKSGKWTMNIICLIPAYSCSQTKVKHEVCLENLLP